MMHITKYSSRFFFYVLLFAMPIFIHAATTGDSFNVNLLIGSDVIAPTVPSNVTATPVTTTQIDLDWDASSDNVSVAGYQVFRDALQIATTSLTSYSDIGLTASTTYTYYITAFDTSYNYSSSTAPIATSTLQVVATSTPVATSSPSSNTGSYFPPIEIYGLSYDTSEHVIGLSFDTNVYTRAVIRWGRTENYEGGYVAADIFKKEHSTRIDGLESGTVYELEIFLSDRSGRNELIRTITITTDEGADMQLPPNVSNFRAWRTDDTARLSWDNPNIDDFSHVRVLSSDYFYPTHPFDGWLVYEGSGEAFRDERVIDENTTRYYTIFVYDTVGNVSSGAVASVFRGERKGDTSETVATSSDDTAYFSFDDILFTQDGEVVTAKDGYVALQASTETLISIPYELLPERLKTIVVVLHHPTEEHRVFSFLLRINPQKTAYEALLLTDLEAGEYATDIELFDYTTREVYSVSGTIHIEGSLFSPRLSSGTITAIDFVVQYLAFAFFGLLLLLLLFFIFLLTRRREDKKVEDSTL